MKKKKLSIFSFGCLITILAGIGIGVMLDAIGVQTILLSGVVSFVGFTGYVMTDWLTYKLTKKEGGI